jgi:predicted Zn-dependent peptidase
MIPSLRLPRGAALVAERAEGARSFAAGFWFPVGSRHEAPRERGFAHFVEHMAFKGTSRRSAAELSRVVERAGGYLNAFTDRDAICLHCQVPAREWRLALDLLADMAFSSAFRPEDVDREREVIASEILAALDDPEECSHDEFLESIWPGDPLSRKIAGESGDLKLVTREALFGFYRAELAPERLVAATAGPIAPEDIAGELARLIEAAPGSASPSRPPRAQSTPAFTTASAYKKDDMEQAHFFEAVQLEPPFDEGDYYALAALNGAIGEASSSRLFLALREDRGLCYSVYSAFAMSPTECLWMAQASAQAKDLPELASEMDRQLELLAERGLTEEEAHDAVRRLSGSFEVALDDTDFRMRRIARQYLFSGEAEEAEEARARMEALSPGDLAASLSRLLGGKRRARFAYGKLTRREARRAGLEAAGGRRPKEARHG